MQRSRIKDSINAVKTKRDVIHEQSGAKTMHSKDEREAKFKGRSEVEKKYAKACDCLHKAINKGITSEVEQRGLELIYLSKSLKQIDDELLNEYRAEELERIAEQTRRIS